MAEKVFVRDIPDDLWRNLKAGASARGMTVSKAVAEAIREWLKSGDVDKGEFAYKPISDLGSSDLGDVAEKHDKYLAEAVQKKTRR
jgi:hypothetical protein